MAIETQVIPVVIGASEVIKKTTSLTVFGSNLCTATLYPQQKNSMREKISFFSIIFDYVSRELKHHIYISSILLFSFHPDWDVLLDEVAFSRLD